MMLNKTIDKFLSGKRIAKPYCAIYEGKFLTGTQSRHRTRYGCKYNKLIKFTQRVKNKLHKIQKVL